MVRRLLAGCFLLLQPIVCFFLGLSQGLFWSDALGQGQLNRRLQREAWLSCGPRIAEFGIVYLAEDGGDILQLAQGGDGLSAIGPRREPTGLEVVELGSFT